MCQSLRKSNIKHINKNYGNHNLLYLYEDWPRSFKIRNLKNISKCERITKYSFKKTKLQLLKLLLWKSRFDLVD